MPLWVSVWLFSFDKFFFAFFSFLLIKIETSEQKLSASLQLADYIPKYKWICTHNFTSLSIRVNLKQKMKLFYWPIEPVTRQFKVKNSFSFAKSWKERRQTINKKFTHENELKKCVFFSKWLVLLLGEYDLASNIWQEITKNNAKHIRTYNNNIYNKYRFMGHTFDDWNARKDAKQTKQQQKSRKM